MNINYEQIRGFAAAIALREAAHAYHQARVVLGKESPETVVDEMMLYWRAVKFVEAVNAAWAPPEANHHEKAPARRKNHRKVRWVKHKHNGA